MIGILTGDIVHSRKVNADIWLPEFKNFLEKSICVQRWEIYRGDSFQIEINIQDTLEFAMQIKALIKMQPHIDVRIAIGIGEQSYLGTKVSESNGSAYIRSGERLNLLKNSGFSLETDNSDFDKIFVPIFKLLSFVTNQWKPETAKTVFMALQNPTLKQKDLAELMGKKASTISQSLKRAAFDEIFEVFQLYRNKVASCLI